MTSLIWMLENDLCRCCHSKGEFINLAEPCKYFGGHPKYVDMLRDSLDVYISAVPGDLRMLTYKICDACASQLLAAATFKKQVKIAEDRFKDMYSRNLIKVPGSKIPAEVKVELIDDSDNDYKEDFMETDYQSDDPIVDIKIEDTTKVKVKKQKPKSKTKKTCKKPVRPKKDKEVPNFESNAEDDAEAEIDAKTGDTEPGDAETEVIAESAEKKGHNRRAKYYTVTQGTYSCDICDRTFASQPLVSQHYRFVHLKRHRARERKCPHCDTKVPGYLRAYHLEEAHGIPAPKCGICDKKFRFPCHVLQHQKKVHMGEKTAQCEICNKSFFNNISLRLHMSTHSEEKRFKCDVCERVFRWENNLKDHLKIHLGDKRYGCVVCGKAFVQKSTLKQHAARNHPGIDVS